MFEPYYRHLKHKLGVSVRLRRQGLGLTQEEAAHLIGIATRHYQKLEAGELNITLRTLSRVIQTFNIDVEEVFLGGVLGEENNGSQKDKK